MAEYTAFSRLSSSLSLPIKTLSSPLSVTSQDLSGSALEGPTDLSPASTVFRCTRPRHAPCFSLCPPSNLFSSLNLPNQPLIYPRPPGPANTIF